jgi:hypothetical protein
MPPQAHSRPLEVVKRSEAKQGFVDTAKAVGGRAQHRVGGTRLRRLAWDEAQLAKTLAGLHFVAFAMLILKRLVELMI